VKAVSFISFLAHPNRHHMLGVEDTYVSDFPRSRQKAGFHP
jgi:hypothetical protein